MTRTTAIDPGTSQPIDQGASVLPIGTEGRIHCVMNQAPITKAAEVIKRENSLRGSSVITVELIRDRQREQNARIEQTLSN